MLLPSSKKADMSRKLTEKDNQRLQWKSPTIQALFH